MQLLLSTNVAQTEVNQTLQCWPVRVKLLFVQSALRMLAVCSKAGLRVLKGKMNSQLTLLETYKTKTIGFSQGTGHNYYTNKKTHLKKRKNETLAQRSTKNPGERNTISPIDKINGYFPTCMYFARTKHSMKRQI